MVIIIFGIVVLYGWPDFQPSARSEQLAESVRRIRSAVAMCRAQAMNEARRYRLSFRPSGQLRITAQEDPLTAPHNYVDVRQDWVLTPLLQEDVWVEEIQSLPGGPPPIDVSDEEVATGDGVQEFDQFAVTPVAVTELEEPFHLEFLPDGSSNSARWVLRDLRGRGMRVTLDGRLGRVAATPVDPLDEDSVKRPDFPAEKDDGVQRSTFKSREQGL